MAILNRSSIDIGFSASYNLSIKQFASRSRNLEVFALPIFVPYEFPHTADNQYFAFQSDDRVLFSRRQQLNMTQQELADQAGVPLRQIQRLEAGDSDIRTCPMNTALSICAALLLDPYQFIHINPQPDPDSLEPLPMLENFTMEDPFHRKGKAGRKPIRRDVMTVLFNNPIYCIMIPRIVLEAIGKPHSIDIRWKSGDNRLLFCANNDSGVFDVPDAIYDNALYLAFPSSSIIVDEIKSRLGWDEYTYAVECRLVKDNDNNTFVLCDLGSAQEAEPEKGNVIIPRYFDYLFDDEEDEEK